MANLKRLWDTENKKIVWAVDKSEHTKIYQVWTNDDGSKLYVYKKDKWVELDQTEEDVKEYGHVWKELDDEMVGYYLTSEPTNLFNRDSGDEVAYRFMNGTTVLQSGKVDEGETPEYTGDTPTKESTAQYTYTFSGWQPTVGPITKKTDYKAQFTRADREYTISIAPNDSDYGAVSESSVDVPYGTPISVDEETGNLVIGTGESATVVTTTAEEGYTFDSWTDDLGEALPATVTGDLSVVAVFEQEDVPTPPEDFTITFAVQNAPAGVTWTNAGVSPEESMVVPANIVIPGGLVVNGSCKASDNSPVIAIAYDAEDTEFTTPIEGYEFMPTPNFDDTAYYYTTQASSNVEIDENEDFVLTSNATFTYVFEQIAGE